MCADVAEDCVRDGKCCFVAFIFFFFFLFFLFFPFKLILCRSEKNKGSGVSPFGKLLSMLMQEHMRVFWVLEGKWASSQSWETAATVETQKDSVIYT